MMSILQAGDLASQETARVSGLEEQERMQTAEGASLEQLGQIIEQSQAEVVERLTAIESIFAELVERETALLTKLFGIDQLGQFSAGGPIEELEYAGEEVYAPTLPRTGDVVITHQVFYPPGWLPCYGTQVDRKGYENLYKVIGNRYGDGTDTAFVLPSATDFGTLPEGATWLIRT